MRDVEALDEQIDETENAPISHDCGTDGDRSCGEGYLTTVEAARHMRRSVSWMLRQKDIPYFRGKPNLYLRADLDHWFRSRRRYEPLASRGRP